MKKQFGLPIMDRYKDCILKSLETSTVTVIKGPTGCGKSTIIPQIIYETLQKNQRVALIQPRRIAVMGLYNTLKLKISNIGYKMRLDTKPVNENSKSIVLYTDGMFIREFLFNKRYFDYIIVDEVHERSVRIDLLLSLLQNNINRTQTKILLMSATIDTVCLQKYFNANIINIEGLTYKAHVFYEDKPVSNYIVSGFFKIKKILDLRRLWNEKENRMNCQYSSQGNVVLNKDESKEQLFKNFCVANELLKFRKESQSSIIYTPKSHNFSNPEINGTGKTYHNQKDYFAIKKRNNYRETSGYHLSSNFICHQCVMNLFKHLEDSFLCFSNPNLEHIGHLLSANGYDNMEKNRKISCFSNKYQCIFCDESVSEDSDFLEFYENLESFLDKHNLDKDEVVVSLKNEFSRMQPGVNLLYESFDGLELDNFNMKITNSEVKGKFNKERSLAQSAQRLILHHIKPIIKFILQNFSVFIAGKNDPKISSNSLDLYEFFLRSNTRIANVRRSPISDSQTDVDSLNVVEIPNKTIFKAELTYHSESPGEKNLKKFSTNSWALRDNSSLKTQQKNANNIYTKSCSICKLWFLFFQNVVARISELGNFDAKKIYRADSKCLPFPKCVLNSNTFQRSVSKNIRKPNNTQSLQISETLKIKKKDHKEQLEKSFSISQSFFEINKILDENSLLHPRLAGGNHVCASLCAFCPNSKRFGSPNKHIQKNSITSKVHDLPHEPCSIVNLLSLSLDEYLTRRLFFLNSNSENIKNGFVEKPDNNYSSGKVRNNIKEDLESLPVLENSLNNKKTHIKIIDTVHNLTFDAFRLENLDDIVAQNIGFSENVLGDVLIFVPGEKDVHELYKMMKKLPSVLPFKVFGAQKDINYDSMFENKSQNLLRVFISTNVCETSITLPTVRFVIDTGLKKQKITKSGINYLIQSKISKENAEQRKGRCNRNSDGFCIRLYTQEEFVSFEHQKVEVITSDLSQFFLTLISAQINIFNFRFLSPPSYENSIYAIEYLMKTKIVAILPSQKLSITEYGKKILKHSFDIHISNFLEICLREDCYLYGLMLACMISQDNYNFIENQNGADPDIVFLIKVFFSYMNSENKFEFVQCSTLPLNGIASAQRLFEHIYKAGSFPTNLSEDQINLTEKCFSIAFAHNTAFRQKNGSYMLRDKKHVFWIHPSSFFFRKRDDSVVFLDVFTTNKMYMRIVGRSIIH